MTGTPTPDLLKLVARRRRVVARFLEWAAEREANGRSLRWRNRSDIPATRAAAARFPEQWWGVVVFTCFWWSTEPTKVIDFFQQPRSASRAADFLHDLQLPPGAIGGHRVRPGHQGAKDALISACAKQSEFRDILTRADGGFEARFQSMRALPGTRSWGRTTCFDLILRAGALGLAGRKFGPELAYLGEATGPARGFEVVLGTHPCHDPDGSERLLQQWSSLWVEVADAVHVDWIGEPYDSGDFENALCIYQERPNPGC